MLTLVLADNHAIVRRGLRALLAAEEDFRILGEADNGLEAVQLVERLQPDVLIVDLMMPGLSGLEVTRQVQQRCPRTRVLIFSMHTNEAYVLEALRNGALGYALKDAEDAALIQAVRTIATGKRYLSPPLSERAVEVYLQKAQGPTQSLYDTLTNREREVLQLTVEGCTRAETAERLSLSPRTVETHRANVLQKLGLRTQTDLIRYALQRGLFPADGSPAGPAGSPEALP